VHLPRLAVGPFLALIGVSGFALLLVPSLVAGSPPPKSPPPASAASAVGPLFAGTMTAAGAEPAPLEPAQVQEGAELAAPEEQEFLSPQQVAALQPAVDAPASLLAWPAHGLITSTFGPRWDEFHRGIDIAVPYGSVVRAAEDGVVTRSGWYYGYGRVVVIDHANGLTTLYGHNSRLLVSAGDRVEKGQPIALAGSSGRSTGPHVHFEVHVNGRPVNPLRHLP